MFADHVQSPLVIMSPPISISTPWLLIRPMFWSVDVKPVTCEIGTSWSRFFESRLKNSTVPRKRLESRAKSIPTFVLLLVSNEGLLFPIELIGLGERYDDWFYYECCREKPKCQEKLKKLPENWRIWSKKWQKIFVIQIIVLSLQSQKQKAPWLNWIEHLTTDQKVTGLNPVGVTKCLVS